MKRNWIKLITIAILALIVALGTGICVYAEENVITSVSEKIVIDSGNMNNEELATAFINQKLYGSQQKLRGATTPGYNSLGNNEPAKNLYSLLKPKIQAIANGTAETGSSEFAFTVSAIWGEGNTVSYSAADLGETEINQNNFEDVSDVFLGKIIEDVINHTIKALLTDCPYELYWFDKTGGVWTGASGILYNENSMYLSKNSGVISLAFTVAESYRLAESDQFTVKLALYGQKIEPAISNAETIITANASLGDFAKLTAYKTEICSLTDYNHDAAENTTTPYGDPWQMIWVFDGDPDTMVVCEGYSKAFQYLCEQSTFRSNKTKSTLVSGTMDGENHMWNVVTMGDGKNYMADITNSDAGHIGQNGGLFLSGHDNENSTSENTYLYYAGNKTIKYVFNSQSVSLFGTTGPALSSTDYIDDPEYDIALNTDGNGSITAFVDGVSADSTVEGKTVTLTVTPDTGYTLGSLTYTYTNAEGTESTITFQDNDIILNAQTGASTATFTMPAADVTVNATFSSWKWLQNQLDAASTDGNTHTQIVLPVDISPTALDTSYLEVKAGTYADIDLNGHVVNRGLTSAVDDGNVITVYGTLVINDSAPSATHSPAVTYTDPVTSQSVTVTGGIITGGKNLDNGGGICIRDAGRLTLNSGTICGNTAAYGGGIRVSSNGASIINGGAISGNTSTSDGGGVFINTSTGSLTMGGGTITSNSGGIGGGVSVLTGRFTMTGGTITENSASIYGGGVYVYPNNNCQFNISGSPVISGNKKEEADNNVRFNDTTTFTINDTLTQTALIGISLYTPESFTSKVFTSGLDGKGTEANFASDNANYTIGLNADGEALLGVPVTVSFAAGTGGSGSMNAATAATGSVYTLPTCDFSAAADTFDFKKWAVEIGEENPVLKDPNDTITVTAATIVTAVWKYDLPVLATGQNEETLLGVGIRLLKGTETISTLTSGSDSITIADLAIDTQYTLQCTAVPDGYYAFEDTTFTMSETGVITVSGAGEVSGTGILTIGLEKTQLSVLASKSTGEALAGVGIQVLQGSYPVDTWDSTDEAHVIEGLIVGTEYTISMTPVTGYALDSLTYSYQTNESTTVTITIRFTVNNGICTGSFTMPESDVTVTATWKKLLGHSDISITIPSLVYQGSVLTPEVTVKDGETPLTEGTDYLITLPQGRLNAGNYTVTVTAADDSTAYSGSQTAEFTVEPRLVTVTADNKEKTYDGKTSTDPALTATVDGAVQGEEIDYALSCEHGQDVADGGYPITVTPGSNPNYTVIPVNGIFTIQKKTVTVTTGGATKAYDGTPLTKEGAAIEGLVEGETATASATGTLTEVGTIENTYSINWGTAKEANYTITEALGTLKVTENDTLITLTAPSDEKVYDGTALTCNGNGDKKVTADGLPSGFTLVATASGSQTDAGSSANVVDDNYQILNANNENKAANFTNVKKVNGTLIVTSKPVTNPTVTLSTDTFSYTGSEIEPTVTVKDGNTEIPASEYTVSYINNVGVAASNDTNAPTVTIKDNENGNYTISETSIHFTITKAVLTENEVDIATLTYNGKAQDPEVKVGDRTLSQNTDYTVIYSVMNGSGNYSVLGSTPINTGNYRAELTFMGCYDGVATKEFTIAPCSIAGAIVALDEPTSLVYDGSEKTVSVSSVTLNDNILNMNVDYAVTGHRTGTNEGTYTVIITGKANYTGTVYKTWTITKANATITSAPTPIANLIANGKAQALVTAGSASGGTMQYAIGTNATTAPSSGWNTELPTGTNVGTYYVWYKAVGKPNYNDTASFCVQASIAVNQEEEDRKAAEAKAAADKAAFADEKTTQKTAADALAVNGDSAACQQLIQAAKAQIDALTYNESKELKDNKAAIAAIVTKLSNDLATQRAAEKAAAEKAEADKTAAGTVTTYLRSLSSASSKASVAETRAMYNALTEEQKQLVAGDDLVKLENAEKAVEVTVAIEQLTSSSTKADVEAARAKYNALSDEQKQYVSADTVSALTNVEKAVEEAANKPVTGAFNDSTGCYTITENKTAIYEKPAKVESKIMVPDTVDVPTVGGGTITVLVTEIKEKAFSSVKKKLTELTIGNNVEIIGKSACEKCEKLTTIKGGAAVKEIRDKAFASCTKLKKLPTFNNLVKIGKSAFAKAKALTKFVFGEFVSSIGSKAFYECGKLKTLTFKGTVKLSVASKAFDKIASNAKATIKKAVKKDYTKALKKGKLKESQIKAK